MAHKLRVTDEDVLICEGARVAGNVTLGKGVSVWYNAVIRGDEGPIVVGDNTNIQDGVVLHTGIDKLLSIGSGCTIGHNAVVHGCTIGNNVLVGSGAKVLGPFTVGENSRIAAGAVVLEEVPPNSTAVGVPAQIVRVDGRPVYYADDVDQIHIKNPTLEKLAALTARVEELERQLKEKEQQ